MATRKALALVSGLIEEINTPTDKLDFAGNTTTDLTEGTNLYYLDSRARASISVTDTGGDGSLSYDNSTGVITYTGPSASEVRAHFSVAAGSGLTYNSSTGEFGTNAIPNAQLANSSVTLGSTLVNLGDTLTTLSGFTELQATTFNASAAGSANNISVGGGNIIFEGTTPDANELTFTVEDPTADQTITLPDATGTVALLESLSATNTGSGYGSLSYDNTTGVFDFSVVTDANIRGSISVTDAGGDGSLSYNSGTGVITYTGPSASEVRAHFSVAVGSGLTYDSGTGEFGTSNIPNSQLQNSTITLGSSSAALGSTLTTIAGLTSVTSAAIITDDNGFRIRNNSDNTKQIAFNAANISTTTTRTFTAPNSDGTLVLLEANNAFIGINSFINGSGQSFRPASLQDGFIIQGRAGGANNYSVTFATATLSNNQTATFPDLTGNVLLDTSTIPGDTFTDDTFRISDDGDSTKKLAFECSGITTSTTRTMTVPDSNGTISTEDFATAVAIALG
jgi:hypothetical protein